MQSNLKFFFSRKHPPPTLDDVFPAYSEYITQRAKLGPESPIVDGSRHSASLSIDAKPVNSSSSSIDEPLQMKSVVKKKDIVNVDSRAPTNDRSREDSLANSGMSIVSEDGYTTPSASPEKLQIENHDNSAHVQPENLEEQCFATDLLHCEEESEPQTRRDGYEVLSDHENEEIFLLNSEELMESGMKQVPLLKRPKISSFVYDEVDDASRRNSSGFRPLGTDVNHGEYQALCGDGENSESDDEGAINALLEKIGAFDVSDIESESDIDNS
jgi:hypothetical protein